MRLQIYTVLIFVWFYLHILDALPVQKGSKIKYDKTDVMNVLSLSENKQKQEEKENVSVSNDKDEHEQECEEIFVNKHGLDAEERPQENLQHKKTPHKNKKCTSQNEKQNKGIGNGQKEEQESLKEKGRPFEAVGTTLIPKAPTDIPCPIKCSYGACYMAMGIIPICPISGGMNRYGRRR